MEPNVQEISKKVRIFFLRDEDKFPVACIASVIDGDKVRYAVSTHNPKDSYNKPMARHIAEERLAHKKEYVSITRAGGRVRHVGGSIPVPSDVKAIKYTLLTAIAGTGDLPQRARDAAAIWLTHAEERIAVDERGNRA